MAKVFLITGTRKGLGRQLAEHYLARGHIVAGCSRGEGAIEHENYRHFCLDVGEEKQVVAMVRSVKKEFKRIDVLLNNAGIASMNHCITTAAESVEKIFATNFTGTFLFARETAKVMMRQKSGRIVNYSSVAAALRLEGEAVYAASKAAVENLTQTMAKELASFHITVNAVAPTPVKTDLIKAVPEEKIEQLLQKQAIKRMGTFEDVQNAIDFFLGEKSDFITAQVLYLGGVHN